MGQGQQQVPIADTSPQGPQLDAEKFIRVLEGQRNSALTQAAQLAAVLETEQETNESLTKELEEARTRIDELEKRVAQATPRGSENGKDAVA